MSGGRLPATAIFIPTARKTGDRSAIRPLQSPARGE